MEDFEQQIRNALARKEPSFGFETRVLAAARRPNVRHGVWRWASALAAGIVLVMGITWEHERAVQERAAGEAAKERLKLALKITSMKLSKIQQKVEAARENN
jgi:hypothetical protein